MKKNIVIVLAIVLSALFFLDCFMFPENELLKKTKIETTNSNGFAVVEFFTSEGCSSCPPADELMAKLQYETKDKKIYLLAYHVDYWDRLGWKDQFSAKQFTNRQQQYQDWLNLYVLYTPQSIINGTTEFASYSQATFYNKISDALATKQTTNLSLAANVGKDSLEIHFKTNLLQKNTSLFIATIQKHGATKVERGENKGSMLHHVQIVRQLDTTILNKKEGYLAIVKPDNFNIKDWEIIGFVQNKVTGKITSAAKVSFQ